MSRSYRKNPCGKKWLPEMRPAMDDVLGYINLSFPDWGSSRMGERKAIHAEMSSGEYGDALFPKYLGDDKRAWFMVPRHHPLLKERIRTRYFREIACILNGQSVGSVSARELFLLEFRRIKGIEPEGARGYAFEWLNLKAARKAIKAWEGEPLDVLAHLTRSGLIEKAIGCEFRMATAK